MLEEKMFDSKSDLNGFMNYDADYNKINYIKFSEYCPIFNFATENLDSYFRELNVMNKSVLTVTSSGDQLINLALLGASSIDCFDINKLCYYYVKLKLACLINLSYEEFIEYFTYCKTHARVCGQLFPVDVQDNCYSYHFYNKVRGKLDNDVKYFFDMLYHEFHCSGYRLQKKLFHNMSMTSAIQNNTYLTNSENYYKARTEVIKLINSNKIRYYNADIFELHKINQKYDLVLLSNIYYYMSDDEQHSFVDYIRQNMNSILNDNAIVTVDYKYGIGDRVKNNGGANNLAIYIENIKNTRYVISPEIITLNTLGLSVIRVPSAYRIESDYNEEDAVYVYRK